MDATRCWIKSSRCYNSVDYSAVGQTTHLAAWMEQLALPGTIRLPVGTLATH